MLTCKVLKQLFICAMVFSNNHIFSEIPALLAAQPSEEASLTFTRPIDNFHIVEGYIIESNPDHCLVCFYEVLQKNNLGKLSAARKAIMRKIKLNCGLEMPMVGLGTWRAQPQEMVNAVNVALESGYRHIDTAYNYNTEESIGKALKTWMDSGKVKREELFITTKLPNFGNRPSDVERFLNESLQKLQLDYVDLYLMHMPFSFHLNETSISPLVNEDGTFSLDTVDFVDTWKVMEQQVNKGRVKAIGVSNFNEAQLRRLYDNSEIKPAVLQVEMHAYLQQKELKQACDNLNVAVTAYSPLGSPGANNHFSTKYNYTLEDFPDILGHPDVIEISKKYDKTPGQVLLKHLIQLNVVVIPKSGNPDRLKSNINLFDFELSPEDMSKLDQLDRGEDGRIFNFLFFKGVENHPHYPFKNK